MTRLELLSKQLAKLILDKEQALVKQNTSRLTTLDREISQLQNQIKNLKAK